MGPQHGVVASAQDKAADSPSARATTNNGAAEEAAPDEAKRAMFTMDGNEATATVAFAMSEVSFIFPITPSSTMAELADAWSAAGRKNLFGQVPEIFEMESEGGAAGALHGALVSGALATTFTASQGLLLMVPNMYKIAGELLPCVIHVAARAIAGQALSIFGDHSDVMLCRSTGWALLSSHTVQECVDMALVAHLSTLKASVPFIHFFEGFRISHEVSKIDVIDMDCVQPLVDEAKLARHRARAMNPNHPNQRGTAQGPDVFFQAVEAGNTYYENCASIVEETMEQLAQLTGRHYKLFEYEGAEDAEYVIVIMGAGAPVVKEAINVLQAQGKRVGMLKIRLFRPWCSDRFLTVLPKTTKKIAVLDRCKESGALGEPLYLDVSSTLNEEAHEDGKEWLSSISVIGGRFGLGSKDFTPGMAMSVYAELEKPKPKNHFTLGIQDDITFHSLDVPLEPNCVPAGTVECLFWGMGSDGTVGANKEAIKIIGSATDLYAQGYFAYDAHKSGGVTVSHLRFGPSPITSQYLVRAADYVAVHHSSYFHKYDWYSAVKPGAKLVLNCEYPAGEVTKYLPVEVKQHLAKLDVQVFSINALEISRGAGLGKKINMIMQSVFFYLSGVLAFHKAMALLRNAINKAYSKKGPEVVEMNYKAVDQAIAGLHKIEYDREEWAAGKSEFVELHAPHSDEGAPKYVKDVVIPVLALKGDELPVSAFTDFGGLVGGVVPPGTTKYERRQIAATVPKWVNTDKCTQCNECSFVCPHAAIRPQLTTAEEREHAPEGYHSEQAKGSEASGLNFRIQVSPYDCTGCEMCAHACPQECLEMHPVDEMIDSEDEKWDWGRSLPSRGYLFERNTVKGSQFQPPLLEFSGACEGCGETPYVKLLTQLFGERMVVANATGCSSIWGASAPVNPYTTDVKGRGPAWANSLFEDNAQFGLGIATGIIQRRMALKDNVRKALAADEVAEGVAKLPESLSMALAAWLEDADDAEGSKCAGEDVETELEKLTAGGTVLRDPLDKVYATKDLLTKPSIWVVGGDGWAYDIGFGGLDHVLSSGIDLNVLVLDTEMYSNTGGQRSKSTPLGAVVQFAAGGKRRVKKDLGAMAMAYGDVYTASVCLEADYAQVVRSFSEAERYKGTSIILAFAPCILQGLRGGMSQSLEYSKQAVDTGYWTLYRFHPERTKDENTPPLILDSKKVKGELQTFLDKQNRFVALKRRLPQVAAQLSKDLKSSLMAKRCTTEACAQSPEEHKKKLMESFKKLVDGVADPGHAGDVPVEEVVVLYGSETGNAENLAHTLAANLKTRKVVSVSCKECDETPADDLEDMAKRGAYVVVVISTAGQGEFPKNSQTWFQELCQDRPEGWLSKLKFAIFGLGDSAYCHFCKAAFEVERRLGDLGAVPLVPRGVGDDQSPDKYETAWMEWQPELFDCLKLEDPERATSPPPPEYTVKLTKGHHPEWSERPAVYPFAPVSADRRAFPIKLIENKMMADPGHDRDVRNLVFDISGAKLRYYPGDCLAVYPRNNLAAAVELCQWLNLPPDSMTRVKCLDAGRASKAKRDLPRGMTVLQLFTDVLDVFGRPLRSFYEAFSCYVEDPTERAAIELMLSRTEDGAAAYKAWIDETPTYTDVFKTFPSCKKNLDIAHILDLVPTIKPRLYSIASSQREVGLNKMELAVVVVDWKTPSGKERVGTCTSFLRDLVSDPEHDDDDLNTLMVYIQPTGPGGIFHPQDAKVPVMMVGLGTGLAPFRAMVQERKALARAGVELGESALYFGCRTRKDDYLFGDEWDKAHTEGYLSELRVAFSRDQAYKIYVQDKIKEDPALVWRILVENEGYFFFCGPARHAPQQVRDGVEAAFVAAGNLTKEEASEKIDELVELGRYVVEAWA